MELQVSDLIGLRLESLEIKVEGLQIVPDCFGGLQRLRYFWLECLGVENNLVESFRNLSALEGLTLRGKGITELPTEFGCFTTLRSLRLERTAVQALPGTSGKFSQLKYAWFIDNLDLRSLPDSFGQLAQLQSLDVWDSEHFSTLPDSVGSLTNLERLHLDECRIQALPASFSNLTRLVDLKLRCEDGAVPVAARNLINLVYLKIKVIGRQPVGDIFGQLSKLESLTLQCHAMENLVESFQNLFLLGRLDLSCETVEELPREIGCLTTMTQLVIACPSLQSLPVTLSELLKLKELHIWKSNLRSLPDSFGQLPQLRRLIISSKCLSILPDTFGNLSSLLDLELDCPIQLLPASFANLIRLTRLELRCEDGHTVRVLSSLISLDSLKIKVKTGADVVLDAVRDLGNLKSFRLAFRRPPSKTVRAGSHLTRRGRGVGLRVLIDGSSLAVPHCTLFFVAAPWNPTLVFIVLVFKFADPCRADPCNCVATVVTSALFLSCWYSRFEGRIMADRNRHLFGRQQRTDQVYNVSVMGTPLLDDSDSEVDASQVPSSQHGGSGGF
ncbi:hypothetical protein R1sor_012045 [Riccia sorocarpa]|uniref:Disease resistance R13L4/SHOC-2-like LRR domain-containing protein n=1 Tax=Riccia sorocarpa TaxID=122646 RepID=A0ABD3I8T9_9MARC